MLNISLLKKVSRGALRIDLAGKMEQSSGTTGKGKFQRMFCLFFVLFHCAIHVWRDRLTVVIFSSWRNFINIAMAVEQWQPCAVASSTIRC